MLLAFTVCDFLVSFVSNPFGRLMFFLNWWVCSFFSLAKLTVPSTFGKFVSIRN